MTQYHERGPALREWPIPSAAPAQENRRSDSRQRWLSARTAWLAAVTALAYYLGAKLGLALTLQPHPISTLWPPNSILLAALLLARPRSWPVLLFAALIAHLAAELQGGVPVLMVLCWFVSNAFEALIGAACMRWFIRGSLSFERLRDVVLFLVFGVFLASFLSSFLDAAFVKMVGWGQAEYWDLWRLRFFSNVLAALTLVPVILTWSTARFASTSQSSVRRWLEASALSAGLVASLFLLGGQQTQVATAPALLYVPLPFLLWAAVRFGVRGASTAILVVAFVAIWDAVHGHGPFVAASPAQSALAIQLFLIFVSIPLLTLAAVMQEREHTKEALRENEDRLNLALNAAQMGAWDWWITGRKVTWSPESKRIFGVGSTGGDITLELFFESVHADDRDAVKQAIAHAIRHGTQYELEFRIVRPDGEVRWVMGKGKTVRNKAGRAVRMLGINLDITERKAADIQAEQQREQLFHLTRVAVLGELSGALAHELNQPLTAILSNAQAAQRLLETASPDLAQIQEILEDIVQADTHAGEVIRRLRALLKKGEAQRQRLDLNEVIREVLELARSDLVTRHIIVATQLPLHLPSVRGDRVQLQQVLLNLLLNACEAMTANAPADRRLSISTAIDANGMLQVCVADRGPGVAEHMFERLFEPFFTTKEHGLGLGLSISHTLISAHGGRLEVHNNPDCGVTFSFSLPVEQ